MELFLFALILSRLMQLPFFYIEQYNTAQKEILLDEDTSRHIVRVLRMKKGEQLNLTDGKGNLITAEIINAHKKNCEAGIIDSRFQASGSRLTTIAISLLKNTGRFEWFLEKATEIGVTEIIPLICERTEKQKFRHDRMKGICISAMLQSQQCRMPLLHEPISYELLFRQQEVAGIAQKFIAHCMEEEKKSPAELLNKASPSQIILIGPEGDFSKKEIDLARQQNFIPVSLGKTRLRTETAAIAAATLLNIV
jgi:16S rRNA (uracil1498-N3)-methyltransferase